MFETISSSLGIENNFAPKTIEQEPIEDNSEATALELANDDFAFARRKIRDAIEKAADAMEDMHELAKASELPRAYDSLNQLASNVATMSESLVKLHKEVLKKAVVEAPTNNNTLIVSSTDDIIKMLKNKQKEGAL